MTTVDDFLNYCYLSCKRLLNYADILEELSEEDRYLLSEAGLELLRVASKIQAQQDIAVEGLSEDSYGLLDRTYRIFIDKVDSFGSSDRVGVLIREAVDD